MRRFLSRLLGIHHSPARRPRPRTTALQAEGLESRLAPTAVILNGGLTGLGKRFTPQGYADPVRVKLTSAGTGDQQNYDRFLAVRVVTIVLAPIAAYLTYKYIPIDGLARWASVLFVAAWVFQFAGHEVEGRKPSFFKDLQFLLIGPAWLMHFIYRRLGIPY